MRGVLDVCAIKSPGFGDRRRGYLEDIAVMTGATFVTEQLGLTLEQVPTMPTQCGAQFGAQFGRNSLSRPPSLQVTMEMLGRAQRAAVFKERTTMIATGDHEEEVNKRIAQVKAEGQATDSEFDREKAEERVAKLGGAIGRIKVGAATETELKDKKLRYEDALNSVKAAMDEGIVPGGGSTLVYMLRYKQQILDAMESDDEKLAVDILFRAIQVRLWSRPT